MKMTELFVTKDSISDEAMTVFIVKRAKGIDITTIDGKHHSIEQFNEACEREIAGTKLSQLTNFIPLTREGATLLRDALTKALEDGG